MVGLAKAPDRHKSQVCECDRKESKEKKKKHKTNLWGREAHQLLTT